MKKALIVIFVAVSVSAQLSPEDGTRYLHMMKTRIVEPGLPHTAVNPQSPK